MKVYNLKRSQVFPISMEEAWGFFTNPLNLGKITPPDMGFAIQYISGKKATYAGQIVTYKIKLWPGICVVWVTEITQVKGLQYFIDEQRSGPYKLWHHQHHFVPTKDGVEMVDEVNYIMPLGLLGRLAHWLFVGRQVNAIFDYRHKVLATLFPQENN
ncbi:MAG: SRPBCC family protein [Cyclobacteriaceae bacterium]|nr:SRPBCC family protein [Cyclobacteriaceae bacterium]MCB0500405.1 SRPBCC family protein [Cyclobacteriaceae bacterium]MCB9238680.1 SRPBCC family protein [Flammeovirgaceae bacterium]MCO5271838.1 SRPBCC family protein [Cyclobacteriaceae bacterium]MCW5901160.1 SRPBCC family protein [Cyclobacteriaceae bacterium]